MRWLFLLLFVGCIDARPVPRDQDFLQRMTDDVGCRWNEKLETCFCWKAGASYSLTWVPDKVCGK